MSDPAGFDRPGRLSSESRARLLALARTTLDRYLGDGSLPGPRAECFPDPRVAGLFVSLHAGDRLRGCVGIMGAGASLDDLVAECAAAAARDSRFAPVRLDELERISIEISILGTARPVSSPSEITAGEDGLIVTMGGQRGVLLPQVARERGWDATRFIEEACSKAGLRRDAWRAGACVEAFPAEVFGERAPLRPVGAT
ncbi:MAG: AmmeMemoRadiSam system protein A [Acidobacteria bacterium]|nr:AmmeMemoRadiSam system protein A [Acidobacteriota bacterium]